jgi:dihydrofolate reductase
MTQRIRMPSISCVVARSEPGHIIGCDNKLPWHLKTDLKNFKKITTNHVVVMGRKTFESIGRPLPNRINIVLSTSALSDGSNVFFADSGESALYFADLLSVTNSYKDIFIIGGGTVYEEFKPVFDKVYLTEVYAENIRGDAFFNYRFDTKEWKLVEEKKFDRSETDEFPFAIKVFERAFSKRIRARLLSSFFKPDENLKDWEIRQLEKLELPKVGAIWRKTNQPELPYLRDNIFES